MPTEHVSRVRRATSARMFMAISRPEPILRRAPVTSRNASSSDIGSTSGVASPKMPMISALTSR
ncbi:MAG: hypothetical protein V9E99_13905 [Microthrixaceae bacterium]